MFRCSARGVQESFFPWEGRGVSSMGLLYQGAVVVL
jgi:hypothetical protein